jgi:hypothetical protein
LCVRAPSLHGDDDRIVPFADAVLSAKTGEEVDIEDISGTPARRVHHESRTDQRRSVCSAKQRQVQTNCVKAFSETDFSEDLKKIDVPTSIQAERLADESTILAQIFSKLRLCSTNRARPQAGCLRHPLFIFHHYFC